MSHTVSTLLKRGAVLAVILAAIFSLGFLAFNDAYAGTTDTLIFSDDFDSLTLGSLSGQNGWLAADAAWTVTSSSTGNYIVGGNAQYNRSVISQTAFTSKDARIVVDFIAPQAGQNGIHTWLRRTDTTPSASGYDLFYYSSGELYLDYIDGTSITELGKVSVSLIPGAWYTIEFEAVNDESGNPVLKGWVYLQGTERPSNPNVSATDTAKHLPDAGYVGLGGLTNNVTADTILIYSGDLESSEAPAMPISLSASASTTQVTLNWSTPANGGSPITDYVIEYRTGSDAFAIFDDGESTATTATVTGLATSTTYSFRVSAVNALGTGSAAAVNVTTRSGIETSTSTPALIDHVSASGNPNVTTQPIDTSSATLLIATVSTYGSVSGAQLTDSNGNTWRMLANHAAQSNVHTAIWYAYDKAGSPLAVSSDNTVSVTTTGGYPAVNFSAWSGTITTGDPLDVQNGKGGSGSSINSNPIVPTQNNDLVITSFGADTPGTYTVDAPFEAQGTINFLSGSNMGNASAYFVQTTAGEISATWRTGGGSIATAIAAFKSGSTEVTIPGVPAGLQATPGSSQVILSWGASSNGGSPITDYVIEYRTGSDAFAIFDDGESTATTVTVTGLDESTQYDFRVSAINSYGPGPAATVSATTTTFSGITITSPSRSVVASSTVATIGIYRNECNVTFHVPYIQTSDSLSVAASVDDSILPNGGGVRFVLTSGASDEIVLHDHSAPFAVTFENLPKGEYTLDTYVVDSNLTVQPGSVNHDTATNIGIGDIYVAIGDSVTEGYDGIAYNVSPYTDWTNVPVKSADGRNYPQCGISSGYYQDHWQEVSHHIPLNETLAEHQGYPVFILNEGVAGITSGGYVARTGSSAWQDRILALEPNKWLLHLGINDGGGSSGFQANMQTIVGTLKDTYGAAGKDIVLAVPSTRTGFYPYIRSLIAANDLTAGPDFNAFYANHSSDQPALYSGVHPTAPGHVQMGRLWGVSIISPEVISAAQSSSDIVVQWSDLSAVEPSIAGYTVHYGLSADALDTVIDAGDTLTATIDSGLISGQTYYVGVQGYDDDAYAPNLTATSSLVSISYDTSDATAPGISSITTSVTQTTATIIWITDEESTSVVNFGLDADYGSASSSPALSVSHSITLTDLVPSTTYHYQVESADVSDNISTSSDLTFTTSAIPDVVAPVISSVTGNAQGTDSATITWLTDEASDSLVEYGESADYGLSSILDSTLVMSHSVHISGLSAGTSYHYRVISKDISGNIATSSDQTFVTAAQSSSGGSSGGGRSRGGRAQASTAGEAVTVTDLVSQLRTLITAYAAQGGVLTPAMQSFAGLGSSGVQAPGEAQVRDLEYGAQGEDVRMLQALLIGRGHAIPSGATGSFFAETQTALMAYQIANGVSPAAGYFGAVTRAQMKSAGMPGLWW